MHEVTDSPCEFFSSYPVKAKFSFDTLRERVSIFCLELFQTIIIPFFSCVSSSGLKNADHTASNISLKTFLQRCFLIFICSKGTPSLKFNESLPLGTAKTGTAGNPDDGYPEIDNKTLNEILDNAHSEAVILKKELVANELSSLDDWRFISRMKHEVDENIVQAEELLKYITKFQLVEKKIIELHELKKIHRLARQFTRLNGRLDIFFKKKKNLIKNFNAASEKVTEQHENKKKTNYAKDFFKSICDFLSSSPGSIIENPHLQPAYLINRKNNCWMNSSVQVLLAKTSFLKEGIGKHPEHPVPIALKELVEAVESGSIPFVDTASQKLHRALSLPSNDNANFELCCNRKQQKDAALFFEFVLPELGYGIEIEEIYQGIGDKAHCTTKKTQPAALLKIQFNETAATLQQAINYRFSSHMVDDPHNIWRYNDIDPIPIRMEQTRIKSGKALPEYLFVQIVRFAQRPSEEYKKEVEERKEMVRKKACDQLLRDPSLLPEVATIIAEDSISQINPMMKIKAPLSFPPNPVGRYLIDFSKAFGKEKKINYELYALIHHEGCLESGHYTADVLREDPGSGIKQWYFCNDLGRQVNKIPVENVRTGEAYILAFKKA